MIVVHKRMMKQYSVLSFVRLTVIDAKMVFNFSLKFNATMTNYTVKTNVNECRYL